MWNFIGESTHWNWPVVCLCNAYNAAVSTTTTTTMVTGRFADKPVCTQDNSLTGHFTYKTICWQNVLLTRHSADRTIRWQLARWMHLSTLSQSCHLVSESTYKQTGCQRTALSVKRPQSTTTATSRLHWQRSTCHLSSILFSFLFATQRDQLLPTTTPHGAIQRGLTKHNLPARFS